METYDLGRLTKKLYDSSLEIFPLNTLRGLLGININVSLHKVIRRLVEAGVLEKLERNKYILKSYKGNEFGLANFLYEPSYVSFESALSYYGILPQFPYEISSATTKRTKYKEFNGKVYRYYKIKRDLFFGYEKKDGYLVADKEKALADQLYLASKGFRPLRLEEYDLSLIDPAKLKDYIQKYPKTRQFNKMLKNLHIYDHSRTS